jgi:hypothetical protein
MTSATVRPDRYTPGDDGKTREVIAEVVPFGALAEALSRNSARVCSESAAELERILRELSDLESRTREAADMLERSARELPEMTDLLNAEIRGPVPAALTGYLDGRSQVGMLRRAPDPAAAGEA